MSGAAGHLDLRMLIGVVLTALGLLIGGYGIATNGDAALYASSLDLNINLWWGLVMLVFGVLMMLVARRAHRPDTMHPAAESVQGSATEEREHDLGLER